jgi:hypothetical protein
MTEEPLLEDLKKKQKKNLKTVLYILGGVLIASILILLLLNKLLPKDEMPEKDIEFYPVMNENIFENAQYLAQNRTVYFCDSTTGYEYTTPITDEDRSSFNAEVIFAETYLNTVILGDAAALREMCSPSYLEKNSIPEFTQQMLYDLCIYTHRTEHSEDGGRLVTYKLMYKIYQNNGTYRSDVGSDGARPEYLVLKVSADGSSIKIYDILR